jgi:hypothetical protein
MANAAARSSLDVLPALISVLLCFDLNAPAGRNPHRLGDPGERGPSGLPNLTSCLQIASLARHPRIFGTTGISGHETADGSQSVGS